MARSISDLLKVIAPEFRDFTDDALAVWIELASLRVNRCFFGESKADFATAFLAAHFLTVSDINTSSISGDAQKIVRSESIGDIKVEYDNQGNLVSVPGDEEYTTTTYGAQYLQLRRGTLLTERVV